MAEVDLIVENRDRIAQVEGILSQLIEELKAAKVIKTPKA